MNRIALTLLAVTGVALTSARADHVTVRGSINFNTPAYEAPAYCPPAAPVYVAPAPAGYWNDVVENVWVAPHWETRHSGWGRSYNVWAPGRYEARTRRVWVDAYASRRDRERWEHERFEHERWNR